MSETPRETDDLLDVSDVIEEDVGGQEQAAAEVVLDDLALAQGERDEYLATLQRLQADFENYRKRVTRASEEAADRAAGALVATLLPVLDALDLATAHFESSESEEATALRQTRGLLVDTLAKEGLQRVGENDVNFDPLVHDAVAHVPGDEGSPSVEEVLRAGYRWRGTVLRPAMVRVRG